MQLEWGLQYGKDTLYILVSYLVLFDDSHSQPLQSFHISANLPRFDYLEYRTSPYYPLNFIYQIKPLYQLLFDDL